MLGPDRSYGLFKVGQNKWIQRLYSGEVSFSCAKAYIFQAKYGGNDEQGDYDEAVFARLKKGDTRIDEMRILLGKDLEIIDDGLYVKLRRKSSCFIPIFCCYTFLYSDFASQVKKKGDNFVKFSIPEKIYDSFLSGASSKNVLSNDCRTMGVFFQAQSFFDELEAALNTAGHSFYRTAVNYELEANEEFFIEPTDLREELFYKRPQYQYQQEERIILHRERLPTFFNRLNIQMPQLPDSERHFLPEPFYFTAHVKAVPAK